MRPQELNKLLRLCKDLNLLLLIQHAVSEKALPTEGFKR